MSVVAAVATSRVARKLGLASRLTAKAVAAEVVERGAVLSALGMFEQGFYDRLGYGTGAYHHQVSVDPANLVVDCRSRPPVRLTAEDYERIHACRLARRRLHGACSLSDPRVTRVDLLLGKNGFGLGYEDPETGEITHLVWLAAENKNSGPYRVGWFAYRSREQFLELLALVTGLGDQVSLVRLPEPSGIQMQDFVRKPFHGMRVTERSKFESRILAFAWWQMRMLDVEACVERTKLPACEEVSFNLALTDPIENLLDEETSRAWSGVAGDYEITFGPRCSCRPGGHAEGQPVLRTSVNTFTRLWLGVQPPSGLAYTCPDLEAPVELLEKLDRVLALPRPWLDWSI